MIDAIKKIDKKYLIIAGCLIIFPIVLIIFLSILQGCDSKGTYEKYEDKMISSAERYLKNKNKIPTEEGETQVIKLSTLVKNGLKAPEDYLEDETCTGTVTVRRNGSSVEQNEGGYLSYIANLSCKEYKTETLASKIEEDIVTEGSGLYETEDGYLFRGNKLKNYLIINKNTYRIMSIDKNGIIKLINAEPENTARLWDSKYNIETNRNNGINIYKESSILSYLLNDYTNVKKYPSKLKQHMVAYDVCIGKRASNDYSINHALDCSEKLEKQLVSLINVSDFAMASIDVNCTATNSKSCANYNYLNAIATSTWTLNAVTDNTYNVFYIGSGLAATQEANNYVEYNAIIYIDGNSKYVSGTGSSIDPYVVE